MIVLLIPVEGRTDAAEVWVNGQSAGVVVEVRPEGPWRDYADEARVGLRWLPEGLPPELPGPASVTDAAMLLLALAGWPAEEIVEALARNRGKSLTRPS